MIYRQLGQTGLQVSILGFGASPLGQEFGEIDPAEGRRAVYAAIERGINYFDVSPYYGRTLAETRLGEALAGRRDKVILATKAGRYDKELATCCDFSAQRITRSLDESLRRLQTDVIDLFQIHDIEFGQREQILNETLPAMQQLKESGKVRFIGITAYPTHLLREVTELVEIDAVLSYCHYNLLDDLLVKDLLPVAQRKGFGLINASPLHMGVLTQGSPPGWHPAPRRVLEAAQRAAALCHERGANLADLAMRFALQNEQVATTLVGMSKVRHLERNLTAIGQPPDAELLAEVQAIFAPVLNVVWEEGLPENFAPNAEPKQS